MSTPSVKDTEIFVPTNFEKASLVARTTFPEIFRGLSVHLEIAEPKKSARRLLVDEDFPLHFSFSVWRENPLERKEKKWSAVLVCEREPDPRESFWLLILLGKKICRERWGSSRAFLNRVFFITEGTEFEVPRIPF